jgi:diacylglycerol O-acyltransferase / wax synthase
VSATTAPLPVACEDAVTRLDIVTRATRGLRESGRAVGAQMLTGLAGFAPPNILGQAARLVARQRFFNLVVTNVPGPQIPLYMFGRELLEAFPMVPLATGQALGVAILSYNGRMNFGLVGDFDALPDLDDLAGDLQASLSELAEAADVRLELLDPDVSAVAGGGSRNGGARRGRLATGDGRGR